MDAHFGFIYRAYVGVISRVSTQMKTFRYVYGITLGATTETRRQNTAAQAVVHHGRSASVVDEFGA